jgi:hypothetical protein
MIYVYLKFATQAAWTAVYRAHFAEQRDGEWVPRPLVQVDEIGTIYHQTGTQTVDGVEVPVMTARPGWHINLIAGEMPEAVDPYMVNPVQPKRVFYGAQVLSMPEPLPEAGGTAMVQRGVGQQVTDEVIARVERAVLNGRLRFEDAADRIALIRANLAIVDAREARAQAIQARDAAIAAVLAADATRDALVVERDAQTAIRAAAIAQLASLTGAARLPVVAVRDAAVAELARIVPLLVEANAAIAPAVAARDAATAALVAANDSVITLRAARDALLAA